MRRRTVLAQLAVFAVISVLIIGYTAFDLLKVRIGNSPFSVTVSLSRAGGIFDGAEVAFRGVKVGKVTDLRLHPDGVTLTLSIDDGTKIPDNSTANVFDLSAVGEQYVDLRPPEKGASPTYLHNGSAIPVARTTVPLETATVLYDLEQFVDSINPADLRVIGHEGALAFTGTGTQLRSILTNASEIIDQLSSSETAMLDLLDNSSTLLRGAADHTDAFDQFTASLEQLTTTLASSTPTITKLIQQGAPTTRLINSLITETGAEFTPLMNGLATLSGIQVARIPGLRALLVAVPQFAQLAPTVIRNGALQGAATVNQSQALCNTGLPLSNPISGTKTADAAVNCGNGIVRGAANAPQASSTTAPDTAIASALPGAGGTEVGAYDPGTGLASTSTGELVRLGTDGGQDRLFGQNSWQAIMLASAGPR